MAEHVCPVCKGKGYQFSAGCMFLTVMTPFVCFLERLSDFDAENNRDMSRKPCSLCKGRKIISLK